MSITIDLKDSNNSNNNRSIIITDVTQWKCYQMSFWCQKSDRRRKLQCSNLHIYSSINSHPPFQQKYNSILKKQKTKKMKISELLVNISFRISKRRPTSAPSFASGRKWNRAELNLDCMEVDTQTWHSSKNEGYLCIQMSRDIVIKIPYFSDCQARVSMSTDSLEILYSKIYTILPFSIRITTRRNY